MYKLTNNSMIIRLSDGANIPAVESNRDYREYLEWLEDGNTPEPHIPPEKTRDQRIAEIESEVTQRNLRSAILGDQQAIAMIQDIEDRIDAIRREPRGA